MGGWTSRFRKSNQSIDSLEKAHFAYTEADFHSDWNDVMAKNNHTSQQKIPEVALITNDNEECKAYEKAVDSDPFEKIKKAKTMLEGGLITEEEYSNIKCNLISKM